MIIHLFGPDSYRRAEKAKELVRAYRAKYAHADLLMVDLEDAPDDWVRARDFLQQPSMFVDSKVLVVREPAAVDEKEWREALEKAATGKGVVAILTAAQDAAATFPFLGARGVERQEFGELAGRVLEMFVMREAKRHNLTFEAPALRYFLAYVESLTSRSARAATELERMALAKFPLPVTRANVEALTAWLPDEELYRGAQGVRTAPSSLERLLSLERLFLTREAAAKLFNIIAYGTTGAAAAALASYDIAVKSGRIDYEEALVDFSTSASGTPAAIRAETFLQDVI